MSRLFDHASSQKLLHGAAVLTAAPITMACWFYIDAADINNGLMTIGASSQDHWFGIIARRQDTSGVIRAQTSAGATAEVADTSTAYNLNTWHHATVVFAAANDRRAYLDGGGKGTNASSATPGSLDRTAIGATERNTVDNYVSGRIAEAAIWNAALDDSEAVSLAKGFSPLLIRPQSLVAYWPLFGNDATEIDRWKNRYDMTVTGATKNVHPRIYYLIGAE